jgi:putative ABC transport system substrate-binding protein
MDREPNGKAQFPWVLSRAANLANVLAFAGQDLYAPVSSVLHIVHASNDRDFDAVFERLIQLRVGALVIGPDNLFTSHSGELAKLTVRHEMPAIYEFREFAAAGGLMSYGSSETEYYRLVGTYPARVLKGDKPADLPVQQSTKVELFLNLKTAKALGITVPLPLSGRADEVFE